MPAMTVAVVASLVGLVTVLVALARDRPLEAVEPAGPDWTSLPAPDEVTRVAFPLAFPGYDPAHVEAHLDAIRRAYEDVLEVVPTEVLERARFRFSVRGGHEHVPLGERSVVLPPPDALTAESDEEALRSLAVLAQLEQRERA